MAEIQNEFSYRAGMFSGLSPGNILPQLVVDRGRHQGDDSPVNVPYQRNVTPAEPRQKWKLPASRLSSTSWNDRM